MLALTQKHASGVPKRRITMAQEVGGVGEDIGHNISEATKDKTRESDN